MLVYQQNSGWLVHRCGNYSNVVAVGYAGAPGFVNDPSADHIRSKGPVPKGRYRVRLAKHPRFAHPAYFLDPEAGNQMHGRSGFWIHGDNRHGNRTASSGCIVLGRDARERIRPIVTYNDLLVVVANADDMVALPPEPMRMVQQALAL